MKLSLQYVNDKEGNLQAVQVPIAEWKKLLKKLRAYEQSLKIKSDLEEAFAEVRQMREGKIQKQTLSDFLHEL